MNIEAELQILIEKYQLQVDVRQLLYNELLDFLIKRCEGRKVGIMCGGIHTRHLLQDYGHILHPVRILDNNSELAGQKLFEISVCPVDKYDDIDLVVISTYDYRNEVKGQLKRAGFSDDAVLDIYDYLEENGIYAQREYYSVEDNVYEVFVLLNNRLDKTCGELKKAYLKKMISAYIAIRDLVSAQKCIKLYVESYPPANKYRNFGDELESLLRRIKKALHQRKERDIVWSWADGLHYEWIQWMPFYGSIREKGLLFENAYGSSVTTRLVYDQIFNKRYEIDDKSYIERKEHDYSLIRLLESHDYECVRIDNLGTEGKVQKMESFCFAREKVVGFQIATSHQYWRAINYIINSEKPVFILIHSAIEVHQPICSPWLYQHSGGWADYKQRFEDKIKPRLIGNIEINCKYLDAQAEFLSGLLGESAVRLFMSDHGSSMEKKSRRWNKDATQMVLGIFGGGISSRECGRLFCLYNFEEVIHFILEPEEQNFHKIFMDEIKLQSLDFYDENTIKWFIENGNADMGISFRGIQTLKDRYIIKRTGEEIYNVFPDDYTNYISDVRYKDRVEELRKKAGNHFIDYNSEEKFKYTHLLYDYLKEELKSNCEQKGEKA